MKYGLLIVLVLLALAPNTTLALEAKLAAFTDAVIANSSSTKVSAGTLTSDGTIGQCKDLGTAETTLTVTDVDFQPLLQVRGMISFWLKPTWIGSSDTRTTRLFLKIGDIATGDGIRIEKKRVNSVNYLRFVMRGGTTVKKTTVARIPLTGWTSANVWHHIAVAWSDNAGKPLALSLWVDKVCVDGPIWGAKESDAAFFVPSTTVILGGAGNGGSSQKAEALMDELIFRTQPYCNTLRPGHNDTVYRDYFQTAPYTAIEIDDEPNLVPSDDRVLAGYTKQYGLKGNFAGTRWDRITDFVTDYGNWSGFDAKPFITWGVTGNSNVSVDPATGLVTANANAVDQSTFTLTATYGPTGVTGWPKTNSSIVTVITPDKPDLDLTYVERTDTNGARLDYNVQQWPTPSSTVMFTAHIWNAGYASSSAVTNGVKFEVIPDTGTPRNNLPNETPTSISYANLPILDPGASTTVTFNWTWTNNPTFIRITVNPGTNSEICTVNNMRCDLNIARAFRWSGVTSDINTQYNSKYINGTGSFSYYDWCQAHIDRWNLMMRESVYGTSTSYGVMDQARVDNFMLDWVTNQYWNADVARQYDGQLEWLGPISPTYTSYIHSAAMHEFGHNIGKLPDVYGYPVWTDRVHLKDSGGAFYAETGVLPDTDWDATIWSKAHGKTTAGQGYVTLMDLCNLWILPAEAGIIQHWATHDLSGATSSLPERRGRYWDTSGPLVPATNTFTFYDKDDALLKGAAVYVYQVTNPGKYSNYWAYWDAAEKYFADRPKFVGNTNSSGQWTLPTTTDVDWDDPVTLEASHHSDPLKRDGNFAITNPFQTRTRLWAYTPNTTDAEGVFLIKVEKKVGANPTETEFKMMSLPEFNEAYLTGYDSTGNYTIRTSLTGNGDTTTTTAVKPTFPDVIKYTNYKPVAVGPTAQVFAAPNESFNISGTNSHDYVPEDQPIVAHYGKRKSGEATPFRFTGATLTGTAPSTYTDSVYSLYVFDGVRMSDPVDVTLKVRGHGYVTGNVTDSLGHPVENVVVGLKTSPSATADATFYLTTDENGDYTSELLIPGTYYVAAWKSGYVPTSDITVSMGDTYVTQNFTLSEAGANIAVGKPTWATYDWPGVDQSSWVVDDDHDTRWWSDWGQSTQDLVVDISNGGSAIDVDSVIIGYWLEQRAAAYQIDLMYTANPMDPTNWNTPGNYDTVYTATGSIGGWYDPDPNADSNHKWYEPIRFPSHTATGIRMRVTDYTGPGQEFGLHEFQAFAVP